ncbi:head completion/stabilization protein [Pseudomonas benzopyrenica]|uniref:head completion/stabilization protein n=1 Tax=Pseudomonas benzopyrenica TaxID=2993566 RepID=UPI00227FF50D|nr:head completion/stabilization protein [Pseudomonas benzopyrenica]MDC7831601.1 head completion/stabilization protein [Pseudomonas benzopyrenica]
MSGFVAGGTVASGQVVSDPFWPAIELDQVRARLRIDSSVTTEKLKAAVIAAAIAVNRELAGYRFAQATSGYATLAAVPGLLVDGVSELAHLYLRAIDAATAAEVAERYRSYDGTAKGDKDAEAETPTIDDYRRDQRWAIRDFLGLARTTVELI